jgi:hypothetical protein
MGSNSADTRGRTDPASQDLEKITFGISCEAANLLGVPGAKRAHINMLLAFGSFPTAKLALQAMVLNYRFAPLFQG